MDDWRGYVLALFSSVWIANVYISLFALIRQNVKKEKTEIELMQHKIVDNLPIEQQLSIK